MLQTIRGLPAEMMPSMAVDLLRGNRLELPWLAGKVGSARARTGRADAHLQRDVRGAQALCQRRAEVGWLDPRAGERIAVGLRRLARSGPKISPLGGERGPVGIGG
jgi:hypothetical protein